MRFDSVVFSDTAHLAALSCLGRLKSERDAGRKTLLICLGDCTGAEVIRDRGLGVVRKLEELEAEAAVAPVGQPWRERMAVLVRRLGPRHVLAPLGLLGASHSIDYFSALRGALSVDRGRDLLLFEERPHCLMPESVPLRLAAAGVRLPPATRLWVPRRHSVFALRLITGLGLPPVFGSLSERSRLARELKPAFKEASGWDPQRALGPKVQPVVEPWSDEDTADLFALATELGQEEPLGSRKSFKRGMARHASSAGLRSPIERYWLSLPAPGESDATGNLY